MASITITVPDAIAQRVLDGIANRFHYEPVLADGTTVTKAQFARQVIARFVKNAVREAEVETARSAAAKDAETSAEQDIVIT